MKAKSVCLFVTLATALSAAPIGFFANLNGASEAPPNASPATGFTTVTIDDVAHTLRVQVMYSGLTANTTASHIHTLENPGDATGPVATTTPTFPGFPTGTSGSYDMTFNTLDASSYRAGFLAGFATIEEAEEALFGRIMAGNAYLNIHSENFPMGEIRGFLAPVPEPSTLALVGLAISATALLRKRKSA